MAHEDYQKDYFIRMVRAANQMNVARDIKNDIKANDAYRFDKAVHNEGIKFFENGGLLEEAPLELRENKNFIHGYEVAKKRQENRQEVYDLGVQKFVDGVHLGKVSEIYRNNPDFIQGYMDAKEQSLIDGIDWKIVNEGIKFFEDGRLLEEAPTKLRENESFVHGYEVAKKRQKNRQEVYDLGVQKFVDGVHLGKVSEIYRNNPDFIQGYMDAKEQSLIDGIDWENIPDEFIQEVIFSQEQEEVDKDSKRHR